MLNNSLAVQSQAFMRWVEAYRNDTLKSEQQKYELKEKLLGMMGVFNAFREGEVRAFVKRLAWGNRKKEILRRCYEIIGDSRRQSVRNGVVSWMRIEGYSKKHHARQLKAL